MGQAFGVALVIITRVATPEALRWQCGHLQKLLRVVAARRAFCMKLAVGVPKEEWLAAFDGGWLGQGLPPMKAWSRPRGPGFQNELQKSLNNHENESRETIERSNITSNSMRRRPRRAARDPPEGGVREPPEGGARDPPEGGARARARAARDQGAAAHSHRASRGRAARHRAAPSPRPGSQLPGSPPRSSQPQARAARGHAARGHAAPATQLAARGPGGGRLG